MGARKLRETEDSGTCRSRSKSIPAARHSCPDTPARRTWWPRAVALDPQLPVLPLPGHHQSAFTEPEHKGRAREERDSEKQFYDPLPDSAQEALFTPRNSGSRVHIFSGNVASEHVSSRPAVGQMLRRNITNQRGSQSTSGGSADPTGACRSKEPLLSDFSQKGAGTPAPKGSRAPWRRPCCASLSLPPHREDLVLAGSGPLILRALASSSAPTGVSEPLGPLYVPH